MKSDYYILNWDTSHWGFRVATIKKNTLTKKQIKNLFSWAHEKKVKCLFFQNNSSLSSSTRLATKNNFKFIEKRITYSLQLHNFKKTKIPKNLKIYKAKKNDIKILKPLAKNSFKLSRFYRDKSFPLKKANDLYIKWLVKDIKKNIVLVAYSKNTPRRVFGFVTASSISPRHYKIGLLAVRKSCRKKGIGLALVSNLIKNLKNKKVKKLWVVTQMSNLPAKHLYQKIGFKKIKVSTLFHKWF